MSHKPPREPFRSKHYEIRPGGKLKRKLTPAEKAELHVLQKARAETERARSKPKSKLRESETFTPADGRLGIQLGMFAAKNPRLTERQLATLLGVKVEQLPAYQKIYSYYSGRFERLNAHLKMLQIPLTVHVISAELRLPIRLVRNWLEALGFVVKKDGSIIQKKKA